MGVKAFTKAAVSDLKGKPQRGLLRSLKCFRKIDHCQGGEANTGRPSGLRRQRPPYALQEHPPRSPATSISLEGM